MFVSPTLAQQYVPDLVITGTEGIWSDSRAFATLDAAITAIGTDEQTLFIGEGVTCTDLTIPSNVKLKFIRTGSINNSGTLTLETEAIDVDNNHQIFTGSGDVDFAAGSTARTTWFANVRTAVNQTTDDTITLVISKQSNVWGDCVIGNNVTLKWEAPNNILIVCPGITISNIRNIDAGNYQLFGGPGDFDFLDGTVLNLDWFVSIHSVINWIESENVSLNISDNNVISSDNIIPVNLAINVLKGGMLTIDVGKTITINSGVKSGPYQIFAGAGTVTVNTYPQDRIWWGEAQRIITTNLTSGSLLLNSKTITFPATSGQILQADANGLPVDATNTNAQLTDAVSRTHTQNSDTFLDEGNVNEVTAANAKDAVDKKHTQNSDTYLNQGGANEVTAEDAKYVTDNALYYPDYNEADQGATGSGKSAKAYIDTIAANNATLIFRNNSGAATTTYTFSTSETVPSNINKVIEKGAILSIVAAQTLTINGPFDAGLYQVFSGAGSVVFGTATVQAANATWWGLATGAAAAINSTALKAAIDSLAPIVKIPNGTFLYDTGLIIDRTLRFEGASSSERNTGTGNTMTRLSYTGAGIAITLDGESVTGTYNIHLSNFSLLGTNAAAGGIKVGTSDTTPVLMSSLKNINIDLFNGALVFGLEIRRCQQSVFENVHSHQNYYGIGTDTDGLNTTLTFRNCHAISSPSYGWMLQGHLVGCSFYQCLSESNGNAGLYMYANGISSNDFYHWHSESNNTTAGTAPNIIKGAANGPIYNNFWGGYFGDDVGGLVWDIGYCERTTWNYITMSSYSGSMQVTANTFYNVFNHWNPAMKMSDITGNALGRVALGNINEEISWVDYSGTSTITGWSAYTTKLIFYKKIGQTVFVTFQIEGTSNTTTAFFTVPVAEANTVQTNVCVYGIDNGTVIANGSLARMEVDASTITCYKGMAGGPWTNSGTKVVSGQLVYQTD